MTDIDEKIIAEAKKPNRKPLIRMGVIAAASAAAVVALGFGVVQLARINQTSNGVVYNAGNSTNIHSQTSGNTSDVIDSTVDNYTYPPTYSEGNTVKLDNVKVHNITVPDEFKPVDGEKSRSVEHIEMLPSEVFDKFGLTMLTGDNFTEELNPKLNPCVYVGETSIAINYILYDKNIGKNFTIRSNYYTTNMEGWVKIGTGTETITLKDGSKAYIQPDYAIFTYNGVVYNINPTGGDSDITEMKQMIADLGIL